MSKQKLENMKLNSFLKSTPQQQQIFLKEINISELTTKEDYPLLQKFIIMKASMEAVIAAENSSIFNLTAQFRNLLTQLGLATRFNVEVYDDKYEITHCAEIGILNTRNKFFAVTADGKDLKTEIGYKNQIMDNYEIITTSSFDKDNLTKTSLRKFFHEIDRHTRYENTLGYDLLCSTMYYTNQLLYRSYRSPTPLAPLVVLIACIPTLIAYTAILPISLSLVLIEKLLVSPFINLVEGCLPDKHNDFIEEVVRTASTLG